MLKIWRSAYSRFGIHTEFPDDLQDETVTAEKLGGQYIVAIVIEGIDCANYAHEITVEAFVKETAGGEATPTATGTVSLAKNAA